MLKNKFGVNCVYKKTVTLGNYFLKRRPKLDKWDTADVVYSVPCQDPCHQQIETTKRKLHIKIGEHERSCQGDLSGLQPNTVNDNGIPYHPATTGHTFLFPETRILEHERNYYKRKILEGIHIFNKSESCVNLMQGKRIDKCWNPLISSPQFFSSTASHTPSDV